MTTCLRSALRRQGRVCGALRYESWDRLPSPTTRCRKAGYASLALTRLKGQSETRRPRNGVLVVVIDTKIVLYQAEWCGYCARVRAVLTDLLLDYRIVNVPTSHAQRTLLGELFGTTGIPSMIDGDVKIADDDDAIIAYLRKAY